MVFHVESCNETVHLAKVIPFDVKTNYIYNIYIYSKLPNTSFVDADVFSCFFHSAKVYTWKLFRCVFWKWQQNGQQHIAGMFFPPNPTWKEYTPEIEHRYPK